jgi:hypothetical protein
MIDLSSLEKALSEISDIGRGELEFEVNNISVTVRVLTPEEELLVQRYSQEALAEGDDADQAASIDFLDRFKAATLSHALIKMGDTDFRNSDFVETEDLLPNGQKVKLPKHVAVRNIISKWSRPLVLSLFRKYGELVEKVEKEAESAIVFEPSDLDTEIERLQTRVAELESQKQQLDRHDKDMRKEVFDKVQEISEGDQKLDRAFANADVTPKKPVTQNPVEEPGERLQFAPQKERQPITPQQASAPVETHQPQARQEEGVTADMVSSFVDSEDPDDIQRAIELENQRLMEARYQPKNTQEAAPVFPRNPPTPEVANPVRRPPHLDAARAAESMEPAGSVDGIEAFRMPAHAIHGREAPKQVGSDVNEAPTGTKNPKFNPPKGL